MKHNSYTTGIFFFGLLLCFAFMATSAFAQDEEPAAPAADAEKPAPAAAKPAAKPDDPSFGQSTLPDDPAVAALLATNPTTPSECARTANILLELHQPALAKQFVKKVADANLDHAQLAALGREVGSAMFLRFSQTEALQPQGKQLGDAVLEALNAEFQNPEKIAAAVKQLQDASIEKRTAALQDLQSAGNSGIAALIEVLADPNREAEFKYVRAALCSMGQPAVHVLIGVLGEKADPKLQEQVLGVLGDMKADAAKLFLLRSYAQSENDQALHAAAKRALQRIVGSLPTKEEAAKLLFEAAKNHFSRQIPLPNAIDGKVQVWQWNGKCEVVELPVEDASREISARLARDAFTLAPENSDIRRLYLAATLEAAAYRKGLDKPLESTDPAFNTIINAYPQALADLLDFACSAKHYPTATVASSMLGQIGKADELLYPSTGQSILIKAVQQPDRRLRMAALQAIVKLKPEKPYPGSSNVTQALAFFAASTGTRRALVAGPNLNKIPRLVSGLSAAGFKVDTAQTGKEVLQKLLASPDYEIAAIDAGISQPSIDILLQQIRRDDRSADVRVAIIARAGFFDKAEHTAGNDPLTLDFPRPNEDSGVLWEVEQLAAIKPRDLVRPEERLREAGDALDMLAELSRSPKMYDVRRVQDVVISALHTPVLAPKALAVLANINSREAQLAILEVVNFDSSPMELRQAAAEAFRANMQTNSVLLKTDEIQRQYDLYNKSENADESVRKIFGLLLDCLEAKNK